MSQLQLEKEVEKVSQLILTKSGGKSIQCNVALDIDVSGSAKWLYENGSMQRLVERVLPVAMSLDDNKTLDMWVFDDSCQKVTSVKEGNYEGYVNRSIVNKAGLKLWGSTNYSPVLKENEAEFAPKSGGFFSKKTEAKPTLIYFFTDGENFDVKSTTDVLEKWQKDKLPLYVMFVGIGNANFSFIKRCGDAYPNVGFTSVKNLENAVKGDEFYNELTPQEMIDWFKTAS